MVCFSSCHTCFLDCRHIGPVCNHWGFHSDDTDSMCQTCKLKNFNNSEYRDVFCESLMYSIHFSLVTSSIFNSSTIVRNIYMYIHIVKLQQLDCPNVLSAYCTSYSLCSSLLHVLGLHDGSLKNASDILMLSTSRAIIMMLKTLASP